MGNKVNKDDLVQELYDVVQTKKAAIAKAEKPSWNTNCAFRYHKESSSSTNIQVCADTDELVSMLALLIEKKNSFDEAQKFLDTNLTFKWFGFTFEEWSNDIKTRIDKIEISIKKKELEMLEGRLDKLISPERRQELELLEIKRMLGR